MAIESSVRISSSAAEFFEDIGIRSRAPGARIGQAHPVRSTRTGPAEVWWTGDGLAISLGDPSVWLQNLGRAITHSGIRTAHAHITCPKQHPHRQHNIHSDIATGIYFGSKLNYIHTSLSQNRQLLQNLSHTGIDVRGEDEGLEGVQVLVNQVMILKHEYEKRKQVTTGQ